MVDLILYFSIFVVFGLILTIILKWIYGEKE